MMVSHWDIFLVVSHQDTFMVVSHWDTFMVVSHQDIFTVISHYNTLNFMRAVFHWGDPVGAVRVSSKANFLC